MAVTFALVHGGWCGAWCWERLAGPLREHGHEAVAMDLPAEDPDAGLDAYADAIAQAVDRAGDELVVVGHSLGGLPVSLVPARRPVSGIVYLAAFIPVPGQSMADQFGSSPEPILLFAGGRETDASGRSYWADVDAAATSLFPDLDREDAEWAFARLRPQGQASQVEPHPTGLPTLPVASIVCSQDRCMNPDWARRATRERLGIEPLEIAAGHFPMLAAPELLAAALVGTVQAWTL